MVRPACGFEKMSAEGTSLQRGASYLPNVDITEQADGLTVLVDLPGSSAEEIDIDFDSGTLSIFGKAARRQPKETAYLLQEYGVGDFYRSFRVSDDIDATGITAKYHDGVLALHLPKAESVKPRKISILSE